MATNGQVVHSNGQAMGDVNGHCGPATKCEAAQRRWNVKPSLAARSTKNPIRQIVDVMKLQPNPEKAVIRLTIGDPTIYNLLPPKECLQAVHHAVDSVKYHGYSNSVGLHESRVAVAKYFEHPQAPLTADDVILTNGCSHALEIVIDLLANPGDNIVIPRPGFPLYRVICGNRGIRCKDYNLLPDEGWRVDLDHLESQIDENTKAIVTNNPSNPCGGVFSKEHIEQIVAIAEKYKLPIVADEVYERVVFGGQTHVPFATVAGGVPVFSVGAVSKRFLAPGWRLGWLLVHDRDHVLGPDLRHALVALTQIIVGPCSLVQGALPHMLTRELDAELDACNLLYERNANTIFNILSTTPGLHPIMPSGAMYMMVGVNMHCFPGMSSTVQFTEMLMTEESVFCLPAECFEYPGYVRLVLAVQENKVHEACERVKEFCVRHYVNDPTSKHAANGHHVVNGDHA